MSCEYVYLVDIHCKKVRNMHHSFLFFNQIWLVNGLTKCPPKKVKKKKRAVLISICVSSVAFSTSLIEDANEVFGSAAMTPACLVWRCARRSNLHWCFQSVLVLFVCQPKQHNDWRADWMTRFKVVEMNLTPLHLLIVVKGFEIFSDLHKLWAFATPGSSDWGRMRWEMQSKV